MLQSLQQATLYTAQFFNNYFQQEEFMDQEAIMISLQEDLIERRQGAEVSLPEDQDPENINMQDLDMLMQKQLPDYATLLEEVVTDYISDFVDIEYTEITA